MFLHCIVTEDEKWICSENPKFKKLWVDPGTPSTSTARPNHFGRKTMLCIRWDQKGVVHYKLLKSEDTVNTKRYQQQLPDFIPSLLEKKARLPKEVTQSHFSSWQCSITYGKTDSRHVRSTQLGISTPIAYSADLTPSDYLHRWASICWVALWFVRRCEKMAGWMVDTDVVFTNCRKDRKMYNKRWRILWIKHLVTFREPILFDNSPFNPCRFASSISTQTTCCVDVFSQQCSEEEGESGGTSASGKTVSARRDSVCKTFNSVRQTFQELTLKRTVLS